MDAIGRGLIFLSEENNKEEQEEGERGSVRDKGGRGKIFAGEGWNGNRWYAAGFFQLFNEKCGVRAVLNILEPGSLTIRCIPIQI